MPNAQWYVVQREFRWPPARHWWQVKVPPWTSILLWSWAAVLGLTIGFYVI